MVPDELRHWLTPVRSRILELKVSRLDLLILQTSLLAGFIRRHLMWFSKSGLWSFSVKKAVVSAMGSVRMDNFSSSTMSLNSFALFVAMCSCACL